VKALNILDDTDTPNGTEGICHDYMMMIILEIRVNGQRSMPKAG